MKKVGAQWTRRIGGCSCCLGDAYVLEGLGYPMGGMTPHVRCDICRAHCNPNARGECRAVEMVK